MSRLAGGDGAEFRGSAPSSGEHSTNNWSEGVDILVTVGTDHHAFTRLIDWMDEWCGIHPTVGVVVQRGSSRPPERCPSFDLLPHDELLGLLARSKLVVGHCGPSTVMDARGAGHLPIIVPRMSSLGEHVDDHQLRFAEHLVRHRMAKVVTTKEELWAALEEALAEPDRYSVDNVAEVPEGVRRFGQVVDELLMGSPRLRSSEVRLRT